MVESCLRTDDEQYICIRTRTQSCYAGAKLHSKCRILQQKSLLYYVEDFCPHFIPFYDF
jgi:hypothetical protein